MDRLQEEKEIIKLEKTILRNMGEEYVTEIRSLAGKEDLEFKLLQLAKHEQEIITTKKEDSELITARQTVTSLNAPYREQLKSNREVARFISLVLKERE